MKFDLSFKFTKEICYIKNDGCIDIEWTFTSRNTENVALMFECVPKDHRQTLV